jgi:hypothetical protein
VKQTIHTVTVRNWILVEKGEKQTKPKTKQVILSSQKVTRMELNKDAFGEK